MCVCRICLSLSKQIPTERRNSGSWLCDLDQTIESVHAALSEQDFDLARAAVT